MKRPEGLGDKENASYISKHRNSMQRLRQRKDTQIQALHERLRRYVEEDEEDFYNSLNKTHKKVQFIECSLPTLGIFTESRESLDLEITMLKILSTASNHKYTEQAILRKIYSVMTDSTSHNLEIRLVADELDVEHTRKTLLYNVYLLMMYIRYTYCIDI